MPKYDVKLCFSGYAHFSNVQAEDPADAVQKVEYFTEHCPQSSKAKLCDLKRWKDADMIEEVKQP